MDCAAGAQIVMCIRSRCKEIKEANVEEAIRVLWARYAAELLSLARNHRQPIDLLLTDVIMTDMSGPELVRKAQALRPEINYLLMSGYQLTREGVLLEGLNLFQKPFNGEALAARIQEVLDAGRPSNRVDPSGCGIRR